VTVIRFPFIVFIPWNWLDEDNGTGGFLAFFPEPRFVLRHGHDDGLGHQLEAELLPGQNLIGRSIRRDARQSYRDKATAIKLNRQS
jgi:hypothetical protein